MEYTEIARRLRLASDPAARAGMARFAINPEHAWGVSVPVLRALAREIGRDHPLAQQLWDSGQHEMRILAGMVADPQFLSFADMDAWAADFDSWDICDQCCMNLFRHTPSAYDAVTPWSRREEEFVKRAAFALIAALAVGIKKPRISLSSFS